MEKIQLVTVDTLCDTNFSVLNGTMYEGNFVDSRVIKDTHKIGTRKNNLNIYMSTHIGTGVKVIGFNPEEVINYLREKGFDDTVINTVVFRTSGIDYVASINAFNNFFHTNVKTFAEAKTEYKNQIKKRGSVLEMQKYIKYVEKTLEKDEYIESNDIDKSESYKKILDKSVWIKKAEDMYYINYSALNLLLE